MADIAVSGWATFPYDPKLAAWAAHADKAAKVAERDPANAEWIRCDGTWFVGVNALPNDAVGQIVGGPPLTGAAIDAAHALSNHAPLDRAQASVCYTGYPRQGTEETDSAFAYRRDRDAAHVDGLHRIMPGRRRQLIERHAYILGIPLNDAETGAAPFVIWEGSHQIMAAAFQARLGQIAPVEWADEDITEVYQTARLEAFAACKKVEIAAQPGEAFLVHRHALHGVGPWQAGPGRRAIAYLRPEFDKDVGADDWLTAP